MPFATVSAINNPSHSYNPPSPMNAWLMRICSTARTAIGKRLTAIRLAQALNCEQPPEAEALDSCGHCRSCRQIDARTHPDFFVIEPDPEQATPQIKIEQVREIEQQFIYRPLIGERKICLIDDADRMTIGAANALLKTLEEPPAS